MTGVPGGSNYYCKPHFQDLTLLPMHLRYEILSHIPCVCMSQAQFLCLPSFHLVIPKHIHILSQEHSLFRSQVHKGIYKPERKIKIGSCHKFTF